ncbi:MAG: hypothetical protein WCE84_06160 [Candidatus Rhabdochlamydia sp.]|jgi:hypothetical protein
MTIGTGYLRLENDLSVSSEREGEFEITQDWSFDIQCNESKYAGVSISARNHTITVVILSKKVFFSFNVTYVKQAKKAFNLFSEKVKKYIRNSDPIKLWKILPYKESFAEPLGSIDVWVANTFPNANVENKKLQKGGCFPIERKSGNRMQKYKPESLYKKTARSISKCYSILSSKEDKFKKPQHGIYSLPFKCFYIRSKLNLMCSWHRFSSGFFSFKREASFKANFSSFKHIFLKMLKNDFRKQLHIFFLHEKLFPFRIGDIH